jgi:hypothetical protein
MSPEGSQATLGRVGSNEGVINAILTLSVAGAYAANDFVGTSNTPITFSNCARIPGGTGMIAGASFIDGDLQSAAGELWLFDTAPSTLGLDSAAFSISDADALGCIAVIPFSTWYASALNSVSFGAPTFPASFKCAAGSQNLYGALVTRGTPTYTTGVPMIRLFLLQD